MKLKWQTLYYMISLVSFSISHFIILILQVNDIYTIVEIQAALFVLVDMMPLVYMTYCHIKMFKN